MLLTTLAVNAQYSGYVGDSFTIPDPPDRYGYTAMNATFSSSSAHLYVDRYGWCQIRSYFTGTQTVICTCLYVRSDGTVGGNVPYTQTYYVTCNARNITGLPSSVTMEEGEEKTLSWNISPYSASAQVTWSTSNSSIVAVSQNGKLTAKSAGTAVVTAENNSGPDVNVYVTVNENKKVSLSATPSGGEVIEGTVVKLTSNVSGTDIYYTLDGSTPSRSSTSYTSEGIAIRKSCTLKAIGYKEDYETSSVLTVQYTTVSAIPPTGITIASDSKTIGVGETTYATYTIIPVNANTDTEVNWSSDDSGIVTVNQSGRITGVKTGVTFIHATTTNGKTDSYKVAVVSTKRSTVFDDGLGAVDVAVGDGCSYVIKDDGTLWAFGANGFGNLGDGTIVDRTKPVKIMDGVSLVKGGSSNVYILKQDKSLWGCGYNYYGQLGQGYTNNWETKPVKITDDVISFGAHRDSYYTNFVKSDHSVWRCGGQREKQTTPIQILPSSDNIATIVSGNSHDFYIKTDKTLWAMGYNGHGQLADGTTNNANDTPIKVMDDVASADCGLGNSFIVRNDGTLWVCGWNDYGMLGTGNTKDQNVPVMVMDNVAQVSAGDYSTFIVRNDGSLWGCGYNWYGELGDGTTNKYLTPIKLMDGVARASVGNSHSLILKTDGSLWSCGSNSYGKLGDGTKTDRHTPVCILKSNKQPEVLSISVSEQEKTVKEGESFSLYYNYSPARAKANITWTSDNPSIASVDANTGVVTALQAGSTYINAVSTNGTIDWCKVTVLYIPANQTVTTSDLGYATFYDSKSAYVLPASLSAQAVTSITNDKLSYQKLIDNIVPAGTPVMLTNSRRQSETFTLTPSESTVSYSGTNLLHGSDEATTTTGDGYHYKMSYGKSGSNMSNVFGWYWGTQNGGAFQIEGHKAWLVIPKSSAATRGFAIDGNATGIDSLPSSEPENAVYYDLQGRRIDKPAKGVYINRGKKVIIK